MPRALVWAILSVIAIGIYFVAVEPSLAAIEDFAAKASTRSIELERLTRQLADREEDLIRLSKGERTHGPITALRNVGDADTRANAVIRDVVLDLQSIESSTVTSSELGFSDSALEREFVGPNQELVRLVFNFNFTASPEDTIEAIRRFEASPEIHAVREVRLRLADQDRRQIQAQLMLDVWAVSTRGGRS